MAVTLDTMVGGEVRYIDQSTGLPTITIDYSGTTNNVTIQYSKNSGSAWTNIATGVTGGTYDWTPDATEITDIFGSANFNDDMRIKLIDETTMDDDESASDWEIRFISFLSIKPNGTDNTLAIHKDSIVNIVWSQWYIPSDNNSQVLIEFSKTAGASWTTIVAAGANDGSYVWKPSANGCADGDSVRIRISISDSGHETNVLEGTDFDITDNANTATPSGFYDKYEDYPDRIELHARASGEKGLFPDEFPTISQFEAGDGVEIIQRDYLGKVLVGDTKAPKKALNLIFQSKNAIPTGRPREIQGIFDLDDSSAENTFTPGIYYGRSFYYDVVHNWDLGGVGDLNPHVDKSKNSVIVDCHQIDVSGDRVPNDVVVQYECTDSDTTRFYFCIKGTEVDPVTSTTVDSQVTLAKDQIGESVGTYIFEFRIKEVVPT
jgi:hypothetical protein